MEKFIDKYSIKVDVRDFNDPRVLMLRFIESGKRILDVGCASGDLGVLLKKEKHTKFLVGIDIRQEALNLASSKDIYEELLCCNLDDLEKLKGIIKFKFDYIIFADVLEHLRFPVETLKFFQSHLLPGGKILATIPNVSHASIKSNLLINDFTYTDVGLLDSTHIHLFTYKTIATELAQAGLLIKESSFTQRNIYGWQPGDPYSQLSDEVKRFIFSDFHSQVCQYVLLLEPSGLSFDEIRSINLDKIDIKFNEAPDIFHLYRKELLDCLSESSNHMTIASVKQALNDDISKIKSDIFELSNEISILEKANFHSEEMMVCIKRIIEEVADIQKQTNKKVRFLKYYSISATILSLLLIMYIIPS